MLCVASRCICPCKDSPAMSFLRSCAVFFISSSFTWTVCVEGYIKFSHEIRINT
jgi:hypothetical protein